MGWEFDDSEVQGDLPDEGVHLAILHAAVLGRSAKGEQKIDLEFRDDDSRFLCYDTVMMEGRGLGIGVKKLQQLGVATRDEERGLWTVQDAETWPGNVVWLTLYHEEYNGKTRAKVKFHMEGFGYKAVEDNDVEDNDTPPGSAAARGVDPEGTADEDIPF